MKEFSKMDVQFMELQETLNKKHVELLDQRKSHSKDRERIRVLEDQYRERKKEIMVLKAEQKATTNQLNATDREYKRLKDLGIESMNQ